MLLELLFCFIATVSFGVIFNVPNKAAVLGGGIGVITWVIYRVLPEYDVTIIFATAVAAFVSASIAHFLARRYRLPGTIFSIPGIIPLLPGSKAYFTMLAFVDGNYLLGLEHGIETMLQAGAIAAGLIFALSIFSFGKGIGQRYETSR
ncbi:threonine/serine exporter family protein [Desertibacillus haloalkaliphilus]|uniref:threonine/serine exporter family protein n=1 Tax=Desertibacillus haloalkaliphilus TaxID=1328930 RepID=UPI001C255984|nr:threonine/serine exporter family protein [Desertibacillus haloalkaliphilus]MBU8908446.1 threonine/serine exporter family protein [Desertibacillus haloalkaliphilus]